MAGLPHVTRRLCEHFSNSTLPCCLFTELWKSLLFCDNAEARWASQPSSPSEPTQSSLPARARHRTDPQDIVFSPIQLDLCSTRIVAWLLRISRLLDGGSLLRLGTRLPCSMRSFSNTGLIVSMFISGTLSRSFAQTFRNERSSA